VTDAPFNSVGLNLYRDQHDSVAPHNDKLAEIVRGQPLALLSLGATRRMTIRAKQPPRHVLKIELETGSLLVVSRATQLHYAPQATCAGGTTHQPGISCARRAPRLNVFTSGPRRVGSVCGHELPSAAFTFRMPFLQRPLGKLRIAAPREATAASSPVTGETDEHPASHDA
jgi:hypothetical protein